MKKSKNDIVWSSKYLKDLGIPEEEQGINFLEKTDERIPKFEEIRKEYGVDPRETWCLDKVFAEWLYTRCKMYLECADKVVNLKYHKFTFKGKKYTQKKAIETILVWIETYFKYSDESDFDLVSEGNECLTFACQLWAKIVHTMWW